MAAVVQDLEKTVGKIKLGAYLEFSFCFCQEIADFFPPLFQVMILNIMQKEKTNRYL